MIAAYDNGTVFVTGDGGEQIILDGTDLNNQTVTNDGG
jgi:hypothetical protein